jgi:hypothetical protein
MKDDEKVDFVLFFRDEADLEMKRSAGGNVWLASLLSISE